MTVTKTFTTAQTQSATLRLRPQETATVELVVAGGETFTGQLYVQRSRSGAAWELVSDILGAALALTSIAAGTHTYTVKNNTSRIQNYRVAVGTKTGDDVVLTMSDVAGDQVEVLLRDRAGNPVLVMTDAGLAVVGDLSLDGGLSAAQVSAGGVELPELITVTGTISAADIVATSAGKLGHAAGVPLIAAPGADVGVELVSLLLVYDRAVATYGDGGNLTVNATGGAALTGLVSAANSIGKASDAIVLFRPLAAAAEVVAANIGFSLVSSAAFTNPGTAAGVVRWSLTYRAHTLALA